MIELKGGSGIKYRIATEEDYKNWYGSRQKYTAKAYAFFIDEEMVGLGGYKVQDKLLIIFSEIKENVILDKLTIYRAAKVVMGLCNKEKGVKFAVSDNKKLCEMLGGKELGGGNFVWQG